MLPRCPTTSRPSLGSLDISSPPTKSALPLTPPLTPASTRPDSRPFDVSAFDPYLYAQQEYPPWTPSDHASLLPSPTSPTHPRIAPPRELQPDLDTQPATRFLFVNGVPSSANSQSLKQAFVACGDLKGIFVRFQADHGAIILAFFDVRHTIRAHRQINARPFFDNARLAARFISPDDLRQLIGQSNFVTSNDGDVFVSTSLVGPARELDGAALQNVLASFGDLRSFAVTDTHARAFHAEYFDARDATAALTALDGRVILGVRLHLAPRDPEGPGPTSTSAPSSPLHPSASAPPAPNSVPFPHHPPSPASAPAPAPSARVRHTSLSLSLAHPGPHHERRVSNVYKFDAVGKRAMPGTPPRPRSISVSSEVESPVAGRLALPGSGSGSALPPAPLASAPAPTFAPAPAPPSPPDALPYSEPHWPAPSSLGLDLDAPYAPAHFFMAPASAPIPAPALARYVAPHPHQDAVVPHERNKIDVGKIERGDDTRTTVMIKNIPNKMSDRHLIEFINDVCPRKIDFLYLRMDFTNGCNVGYAFVNFIRVEDLLHFARAKLGTKWNLFSSEKILGMSYANYQGKEALIDKFRSSSIMDQRESWRPKLFFSSGPKQGLPEDFPGPTHVRRKERAGPHELHRDPLHQHGKALFHHGRG